VRVFLRETGDQAALLDLLGEDVNLVHEQKDGDVLQKPENMCDVKDTYI